MPDYNTTQFLLSNRSFAQADKVDTKVAGFLRDSIPPTFIADGVRLA